MTEKKECPRGKTQENDLNTKNRKCIALAELITVEKVMTDHETDMGKTEESSVGMAQMWTSQDGILEMRKTDETSVEVTLKAEGTPVEVTLKAEGTSVEVTLKAEGTPGEMSLTLGGRTEMWTAELTSVGMMAEDGTEEKFIEIKIAEEMRTGNIFTGKRGKEIGTENETDIEENPDTKTEPPATNYNDQLCFFSMNTIRL